MSTLEGVRLLGLASGEQVVVRGLWLTHVVSLHVTYPSEHLWGRALLLDSR